MRTQGTHLFVIDSITAPAAPKVVKFACPTAITGLGGGKGRIDTTDLDQTVDETSIAGLGSPNAVSVPYNFNPDEVSHDLLDLLKENGGNVQWFVCGSDGVGVPSLESGVMLAPEDRTSFSFVAYVDDNDIGFSAKDVVKGTATLQRSGKIYRHKKRV